MAKSLQSLTGVLDVAADGKGGLVDATGQFTTWREVADQVGQLASHLQASGVKPGDRVAVSVRRSRWSFVAVHGAIAAGAVMVPIDPSAPAERGLRVLDACDPVALLSGDGVAPEIKDWVHRRSVKWLKAAEFDQLIDESDSPIDDYVEHGIALDDPAYIIYTSGSTGEPKGILHTHRSALAYAHAAVGQHRLDQTDRVAATCPLHFDMSTLELYAVPLAGATVVQISEIELSFPTSVAARLDRDRVSKLYAVPFLLRELLSRGALEHHDLTAIREIAYGGESMTESLLADLVEAFPGAEFLNVYGPAEVNAVTSHRSAAGERPGASVPIGQPWPGVSLLVVDDDGDPVATGQPGELWVHAPTMMKAYWGSPDLTKRVVVEIEGRRFYRTGDLVALTSDGSLEFRGRIDNCAKVRGTRVELDEVEAILAAIDGVRHAIAGTDGPMDAARAVTAAVVAEDGEDLDPASLRIACAARLPSVAVPALIRVISDVPRTPTGKLDRVAVRQRLRQER